MSFGVHTELKYAFEVNEKFSMDYAIFVDSL